MPKQQLRKTSTPGIYRRGADGSYTFTWRDASGKQRWESRRTYDEARQAKRDKEREARSGAAHVPLAEQPTLAEYSAELFGKNGQCGTYAGSHGRVRESTVRSYRRDMEVHWLPYLGRRKLRELRAGMLTDHLATLAARTGDEYIADGTLKRVFAPIAILLQQAAARDKVDVNVARAAIVPSGRDRARQNGQAPAKPYTRAEIGRMLGVLEHARPDLHALVLVLATTGLRVSEAAGLTWENVQLDGAVPEVRVRQGIVDGVIDEPKSRHGIRDVPIPQVTVDALRAHRRRCDPRQRLVFATVTGAALRPENQRRTLATFAEEADVVWHGYHGLRHAFASTLIEQGRNIVQVSRLLGHHSASFTLHVYAHVMDSGLGGPIDAAFAQTAGANITHAHSTTSGRTR